MSVYFTKINIFILVTVKNLKERIHFQFVLRLEQNIFETLQIF